MRISIFLLLVHTVLAEDPACEVEWSVLDTDTYNECSTTCVRLADSSYNYGCWSTEICRRGHGPTEGNSGWSQHGRCEAGCLPRPCQTTCTEDAQCCDQLKCIDGTCAKTATLDPYVPVQCIANVQSCDDAGIPCCDGLQCVRGTCAKTSTLDPFVPLRCTAEAQSCGNNNEIPCCAGMKCLLGTCGDTAILDCLEQSCSETSPCCGGATCRFGMCSRALMSENMNRYVNMTFAPCGDYQTDTAYDVVSNADRKLTESQEREYVQLEISRWIQVYGKEPGAVSIYTDPASVGKVFLRAVSHVDSPVPPDPGMPPYCSYAAITNDMHWTSQSLYLFEENAPWTAYMYPPNLIFSVLHWEDWDGVSDRLWDGHGYAISECLAFTLQNTPCDQYYIALDQQQGKAYSMNYCMNAETDGNRISGCRSNVWYNLGRHESYSTVLVDRRRA